MTHRHRLARPLLILAFSAAGCFAAGLAQAHSTLGEILAKGAVKLTREAYLEILPLTRTTLWPDGTGEATLTYEKDGTFKGTARHYRSSTDSDAVGTWQFNAAGQWCIDENFVQWRRSYNECFFMYMLGSDRYTVRSDKDMSAVAVKAAE